VRTLAPLAHLLILSLLLLPTLCLAPEERWLLLLALAAQLVIIAQQGILAPRLLRRAGERRRVPLRVAMHLLPLPLLLLLCWLLAPGLLWKLGLLTPAMALPALFSPSLVVGSVVLNAGLAVLAFPLWRQELQARAEFE
jgi:hypothetical protein